MEKHMPPHPPVPTLCAALTKTGARCTFVARRDSGLCINHDPAYREQQRLNTLKGAAAAAEFRSRAIRADAIDLSSRIGIQALLDAVIRLEIYGRISPARARTLIRALSLAARNFPPTSERQRRSGQPAAHDAEAYERYRANLDRTILPLVEQAEARDAARQTRQ